MRFQWPDKAQTYAARDARNWPHGGGCWGELILIQQRTAVADVEYHFPQEVQNWTNTGGDVCTRPRDLCAWKTVKNAQMFFSDKLWKQSWSSWQRLPWACRRWAVRGGAGVSRLLAHVLHTPPEQPRGGDGGDPSSSRVSGPLPWPVLKVKAKSAFSRCKGDSLARERCPVTAFPHRVLFLLSWGPQMFRCVHDCALGIFES